MIISEATTAESMPQYVMILKAQLKSTEVQQTVAVQIHWPTQRYGLSCYPILEGAPKTSPRMILETAVQESLKCAKVKRAASGHAGYFSA